MHEHPTIAPLRGLLEVTRLIRSGEELPELLDAIARTIAETLGYGTVAINLYRPEWDDFLVVAVHGPQEARDAVLGKAREHGVWELLLVPRFHRRGAYFIGHDELDLGDAVPAWVPPGKPSDDPDAWHPEDALVVPMRHSEGHLLGVVSVDEPVHGRRPSDDELDVLVAVADHAALAVEAAQEAARAARHRAALEQLLAVSSRLAATPSTDVILRAVCRGIQDALGFQNVAIELVDPRTGRLVPKAAVGWSLDDPALTVPISVAEVQPLLDPAFEIEGCFLVAQDEAQGRLPEEKIAHGSRLNGRGPRAWRTHWLLVPLHDRTGAVTGMIWADEPADRLLPTTERLQALRVFANQATAAILSASQFQELRFLADHDPLTRLFNRRAFIRRLESEVARARRYARSFALVLCDLDGFKELNDRHGHPAGDDALMEVARTLTDALRRPDDAFRIGGDEFALLLAEASDDDAAEVVRRVVALLETRSDGLRASFGVAACPRHGRDAQTVFRLADEALYGAKRSGAGLQFAA